MILRRIVYKLCSFDKRAKILRRLGVKVGSNSEIYPNVNFGSEPYLIEIGDNVRITSRRTFNNS